MSVPLYFKCESVTHISAFVNSYALRLLDKARYDECDLGRYLLLRHPDASHTVQTRHYSIVGKPGPNLVEIAVKRQSDHGVSAVIHKSITPNSIIVVDDVLGSLTVHALLKFKRALMLCGGMGVTLPLGLLRALVERFDNGQTVPSIHLVLCAPTLSALVYLSELLALQAKYEWIRITLFITRERIRTDIAYFESGRPTKAWFECHDNSPEAILLSGSAPFVDDWSSTFPLIYPQTALLTETWGVQVDAPRSTDTLDKTFQLCLSESDISLGGRFGDSLLEVLERAGKNVPYQCRMGLCGRCKIRVIDGEVDASAEIGLSQSDREKGFRLACCCRPRSKTVTLDF